jgi:hypothetical protein
MCIKIVEKFAACGCIYHTYPIDPCPRYGKSGHKTQIIETQVGYACQHHSREAQNSKPDPKDCSVRDGQKPKPKDRFPRDGQELKPKDSSPRDGQKPKPKNRSPRDVQEPKPKHSSPQEGQITDTEDDFSNSSADSTAWNSASPGSFTSALGLNDALDKILHFLLLDDTLKCLWPHLISFCADREGRAEGVIQTFLKRYGQDLQIDANGKIEMMASKFIRRRSFYLANRIYSRIIDGRDSRKPWRPISTKKEPPLPTLTDDSEPEDIDESVLERFEAVRDFLSNGRAFNHLQQRLEVYVQMAVFMPQSTYNRLTIASQNFIGRIWRRKTNPGITQHKWTCVSQPIYFLTV